MSCSEDRNPSSLRHSPTPDFLTLSYSRESVPRQFARELLLLGEIHLYGRFCR